MSSETLQRDSQILKPEEQLFDALERMSVQLATKKETYKSLNLNQMELNTLDILNRAAGPIIVGDIQRKLGVLPAQMSRIIRALEDHQSPLVECRINAQDKRKIDVRITKDGRETVQNMRHQKMPQLKEAIARAKIQGNLVVITTETLNKLAENMNNR